MMLDIFYKHMIQLTSVLGLPSDYLISGDNDPDPIHLYTKGGLAQSQSDRHISAYAKMHTSVDRIELDPIAIQSWLKR